MSDAQERFIAEGIKRYVDAKSTIVAFENMLVDQLTEYVDAFPSSAFRADEDEHSSGASKGTWGHAVWVSRRGTLRVPSKAKSKVTVWLELGVWWKDADARYYGGFFDEDDKGLPLLQPSANSGVELLKWSKKPRYSVHTTLPMSDAFDRLRDALAASINEPASFVVTHS